MNTSRRSILITGAGGYLGAEVIRRLLREPDRYHVFAFDVRETPPADRQPGVTYLVGDVREANLAAHLLDRQISTVVHLASIVNSAGPARREFERSVDVGGTQNVLAACVSAGVKQLIVTSSGAAYGYHADNAVPLRESDPLRGNPEFAYSDHKRLVEEMLARYRQQHASLKQLIFRPGTVLGARTDNQITRLFRGRMILGLAGCETPFVFIWDQDVANCIVEGVEREAEGIYNLAGDGTLTLSEIARITGTPYVAVPPRLLRAALWLLQKLNVTPHGPEQVLFLQYRPVLDNRKLKEEFGYQPQMTTEEVFRFFLQPRSEDGDRPAGSI